MQNIGLKRHAARLFAALLAGCLAFIPPLDAQGLSNDDNAVKAHYLFNFTQFVEWPTAAFRNQEAPLVIGVLGDDDFARYLDGTVEQKRVDGRRVLIQRYRDVSEVANCHLLFVGYGDADRIRATMQAASGHAILTVSDHPYFVRQGGIIRFFPYENKIRIQINLEAAKTAGLVISSKLLRLADIYNP